MNRQLVRYLLTNRMQLPRADWTVQGFGFMRLRIDEGLRLHIWDSRLRVAGVSDIHDHTQWAFNSHVITGCVINTRFTIDDIGVPHKMAIIDCGIGGGMRPEPPAVVNLLADIPERYLPGEQYSQEPDEIHRSTPIDGTITLLEQFRRETATARVFWPANDRWGDAIPRPATPTEIATIGGYALTLLEAA